ncbi:MAG: GNAT family protein [Alphaproteobacteria bacterium]|nr:GNAT family protein [Alphaproteobacteria bacterium]
MNPMNNGLKVGTTLTVLPDGGRPSNLAMTGKSVRLEPIDPARHGDDLYAAAYGPKGDPTNDMWTYMSFGPFADADAFATWLATQGANEEREVYALVDTDADRAQGMASYLRIEPQWASCEVGSIWYAPSLKRSRAATEAMYLMARHVFEDLGYRRYEWKCDKLNEASRRAALRLGFQYEGLFRQHMIYKGRNRDTTWFAMIDQDWPKVKAAFETWLADDNFDADGGQIRGLAAIRSDARR